MNVLVTGGAGFIGSHIVDACIADGHAVTVLDDLSSGVREQVHPAARFIQCDIRDEKIRTIFAETRFDVMIHLAAQMDVRKSVEQPAADASINILGSLNLLEQCRMQKVGRILFSSTGGAIYGEQDYFPADENHPVRPISPYGIAKLTVEKYLHYYHAVHGMQYVSLRYGNVYGPRQNPHGEAGVIAIFTSRMLAGDSPVINGDGTQTRDYVYVGDVVKANMSALKYSGSGTFNVGTGIETTVVELFHHLRELTSSSCEERHAPAKAGEQLRSVLDCSLLKRSLDWTPSVSLYDGLRQTVEYFRSRRTK